ncbi:MAG: hypothetical protein F4X44_03710 [Gammaproteobacteria bacterium]|nr:hypothetical protein [Gammaproteobacteria bacterium]MYD79701.1 hypothetical protein [Gammaproteobacteria bacterium]
MRLVNTHRKVPTVGTVVLMSLFKSKYVVSCACIGVMLASVPAGASGIYIGTGVGLEDIKTRYDRRSDTKLFPSLSLSDLVFSGDDENNDTPYTLSGFIGYRLDASRQGAWMAVEFGATLRGDSVQGRLNATGITLDGANVPSVVVEDWKFQAESDRSLVAKLGTYINLFGFFDLSFYVLGGKREIGVEFVRNFDICTNTQGCTTQGSIATATETQKPTLEQWVGGLGIELGIGRRSALQFEVRFNDEGSAEWSDSNGDIEVPQSLSRESYDFSTRLVLQF